MSDLIDRVNQRRHQIMRGAAQRYYDRQSKEPQEVGEFCLKRAGLEDITTLQDMDRVCFPGSTPWSYGQWHDHLTSSAKNVAMAMLGAVPVGCIGFYYNTPTSMNIQTMAVLPEYRGQGLGQRILGQQLDQARERGVNRVTLQVEGSNEGAIHLYKKLGFEITERIPHNRYYPGDHGYHMARDL